MQIIGLTGGIGSGKSTVSAMLRDLGAYIVDADEGARLAVAPGSEGLAELVQSFGTEILDQNGDLDREKLADMAFADPDALARLNAITHPRVRSWMLDEIQAAEEAGAKVVVLDVPLLYESGLEAGLPEVVVVWAPKELQLERAVARGVRPADAKARIAAQIPLDQKRGRASRVIDNSGRLDETRSQVEALWHELSA
ncbi:MAG: dephospho-CoA kinase [Candidatus Dormibacteraeota bacterium]|nr:dephospho-CoA kinase [Candidatus Dormibacteraeota bacterium]